MHVSPLQMNTEFSVIIWPGQIPFRVGEEKTLLVQSRHPRINPEDPTLAPNALNLLFASKQIFHDQCQTKAPTINDNVIPVAFGRTLVIHGDLNSCFCSSDTTPTWENFFSLLKDVEESHNGRADTAYREWLECRSIATRKHLNATFFAPLKENEGYEGNLKCLGHSRAEFAKEICNSLSRRCRWQLQKKLRCTDSSGGDDDDDAAAADTFIIYPSAAFSLAFYSEAFGLLFFCRDKMGFSSLLASGAYNPTTSTGPCFALTTSAATLKEDYEKFSTNEKIVQKFLSEVSVDGVWLLDLWELADVLNTHKTAPKFAADLINSVSLKTFDKPRLSSPGALFSISSLLHLPWQYPSIIRGNHIWCKCASCVETRTTFWQKNSSKYSKEVFSNAFFLPCGLPHKNIKLSDGGDACITTNEEEEEEEEDDQFPTSDEVLLQLYTELSAAVRRAMPEVMHHIHNAALCSEKGEKKDSVHIGILYSGGVDSTLLAGIVLQCLATSMVNEQPAYI